MKNLEDILKERYTQEVEESTKDEFIKDLRWIINKYDINISKKEKSFIDSLEKENKGSFEDASPSDIISWAKFKVKNGSIKDKKLLSALDWAMSSNGSVSIYKYTNIPDLSDLKKVLVKVQK